MITHIYSVTVIVGDQDEAKKFYTETLGWEAREDTKMESMRWLTVSPPGALTTVSLGLPGMYTPDDPSKDTPGGETGVALVCDDIDATYRELSEKGVSFRGEPESMPWGDFATWFKDPWGNEYFLSGGRGDQ
ncbi:VOC family protein [Stackebrandtia soli]|uniref:VOC family protein n=1 Tax=Stackebrandtia soli TaxID=1892856 RepID=UPI0039EC3D07